MTTYFRLIKLKVLTAVQKHKCVKILLLSSFKYHTGDGPSIVIRTHASHA